MKLNKKLNNKLLTKISVPIWALMLFIGLGLLTIGLLVNLGIQSDNDVALSKYKESQYITASSLENIKIDAEKNTLYQLGKMSGFITIILSIGAAIGLSHGIAIVRVTK